MVPRQESEMADMRGRFGNARIRGIAIAGVALLAAALYVTLDGGRNGADAAACAGAAVTAKNLDPLIGGEVAAFQIARAPQKLDALSFTDPQGRPTTLAAYAGKVTLLNIWATWCAPCRQEMPALDRLQAALGGADFSVVPVSIDTRGAERPAQFFQSVGVKNLPLNTDASTKIFEELKSRSLALGLPVTVLLDRKGCQLGHINGPAEWDSPDGRALIEAALKAAAPA
jgi:thiol-disulfide isomerase/thioredoxin